MSVKNEKGEFGVLNGRGVRYALSDVWIVPMFKLPWAFKRRSQVRGCRQALHRGI